MLTFQEALDRTLQAVPAPQRVNRPLAQCEGCCLAEPVVAEFDMPPFNRAQVDGFALRSADLARGWLQLRVIGESAAGSPPPPREVGPGECVRIMTGAPVPAGADAVQMFEETEQLAPLEIAVRTPVKTGANVLPEGSEIRRGARVFKTGRTLGAADLAILAALGVSRVSVWRPPAVTVISTGSELVEVGSPLSAGKIFDSNRIFLEARIRALGATGLPGLLVPDDPATIGAILANPSPDLFIFTGGVSAGDYDYVHRLLPEAGFTVEFHKVAIKPGKPILLARRGSQLLFGLPGNPVSAAVTFELFVRTAILRWIGQPSAGLPRIQARLLRPIRQRPGRLFFQPGRLSVGQGGWKTEPTRWIASSDLLALADADCLIEVPAEVSELTEGAEVQVRILDRARLPGAGGLEEVQ